MKRSTIAKTFTIAAVTALALGIAPTANAACFNFSLQGTFVYKESGFVVSPAAVAGPLANVNTVTFDGNGAITAGAGYISQNGTIIPVTETGTYQVNPDCTGTYAVTISPIGFTAHFFFVIDVNGNLQVICLDPGAVFAGTAKRQFPAGQ